MDDETFLELFASDSLKSKICRLCLSDNQSIFYGIHNESYGGFETISNLLIANSIQVSPDDGFPEVVCINCLNAAINALEFKTKCAKSFFILSNHFSKLQKDVNLGLGSKPRTKFPNEIIFLEENCDLENVDSENDLELSEPNNSDSKCSEDTREFFKCPQCNISFFKMKDLQQHMIKAIHTVQCKICYKVCDNEDDLKEHLVKHDTKHVTICEHCNNILADGVHTTKIFKYVCKMCGQKYPCPQFLESHIKYLHANKKNEVIFNKNRNIKNNSINDKRRNKIYICDICGNIVTTRGSILRHINSHFGIKPYKCDICKKPFTSHSQKNSHQKTHNPERNFQCDICTKSFKTLAHKNSHQKTHNPDRSFQCDICGNRFVCKESLTYHYRIHTGEKPYPCEHCDKRFLSASRRMDHIQSNHMEKVECTICKKKYNPRFIKKHALLHLGIHRKRSQKELQKKRNREIELKSK